MRVLVVDDDSTLRGIVAHGLSEAEYAVDEAAEGRRALQLAAMNECDAIVLDVRMPGSDGFEVCPQLRGRGGRTRS